MRIKTCTAQVTIHFYSFSYYKGVDFLIKVHFKTGLILYRRNNLATLGTSYIYSNTSFYFFHPFRIAHFLWSQANHVCYSLGLHKLH